MVINRERKLQEVLGKAVEGAVQYVLKEIMKENQEQIQRIVYDAYAPVIYQRTHEFKNAWDEKTNRTTNDKHIEGEFFYSPDKMPTVNPQLGQHASFTTGADMREYLADIIYQGVTDSLFGPGPWTQERNAFKALDNWLGKQKMKNLIQEGFRRNGINYKFHRYPTKRSN